MEAGRAVVEVAAVSEAVSASLVVVGLTVLERGGGAKTRTLRARTRRWERARARPCLGCRMGLGTERRRLGRTMA